MTVVETSVIRHMARGEAFPYSIYRAWKMDLRANKGNVKSILVLTWFRGANFFGLRRRSNRFVYALGAPIWIGYRVVVDWVMSIEIPPPTRIGGGLRLHHGQGLVIHADSVLGEGCLLRHSTTIGCGMLPDGSSGPAPVFGDHVEVGAGAIIIGDVLVGSNARIGAGTVVLNDVPENRTMVGNPGRLVE